MPTSDPAHEYLAYLLVRAIVTYLVIICFRKTASVNALIIQSVATIFQTNSLILDMNVSELLTLDEKQRWSDALQPEELDTTILVGVLVSIPHWLSYSNNNDHDTCTEFASLQHQLISSIYHHFATVCKNKPRGLYTFATTTTSTLGCLQSMMDLSFLACTTLPSLPPPCTSVTFRVSLIQWLVRHTSVLAQTINNGLLSINALVKKVCVLYVYFLATTNKILITIGYY